jgi:hypothetical protein
LRQLETRGARGSQWLALGAKNSVSRFFGGLSPHVYQKALRHADARVLPAGEKPAHKDKTVTFTPEEVARVRNAPDAAAAKKAVRDILQNGKKKDARDVVNHLLGSKIRSGPNKNRASRKILDNLAGSIARSLRREHGAASPTASNDTAQRSTVSSSTTRANGWMGGSNTGACHDAPPPPPPPPTCVDEPVTIDIGAFVPAAKAASELMSPLVFDVAGRGLQIDKGVRVAVDLDGDGAGEMVTDLDNGLGLLVFDAPATDDDGEGASREFFGDGTDLSGYGIEAPRADGRWDDGFAALRALCEHFFLVGGDKQYLDENDLAFLHEEIGLRMRIGGLHGDDVSLGELGISRIDLGAPSQVEPLEGAARDRFGNKWMRQTGATFLIDGHERCYADLWFAVTRRTADGRTQGSPTTSTSSARIPSTAS